MGIVEMAVEEWDRRWLGVRPASLVEAEIRWFFFPPRLCEATMLQEGVGDHCHESVTMKTLPGSPFKVIKPEFLFQLVMGLFANPSCLDGGS
jgi:hypothetical protein